jgi:hypothetical protein
MVQVELDLQKVLRDRLQITLAEIDEYCQRWKIAELALFGSVVRDDFRADSDVDVLVTFTPDQCRSGSDIIRAQQELEEKFGRVVDLTQKKNLANPFSRAEILRTYQIIYPSEKATSLTVRPANKIMQDNARNNAALLDMMQAIQNIQEDIAGMAYENYLVNRPIRQAVERNCEIIGEAVRRIMPEFRAAHTEVNWGGAVGLRNILIHQYDQIDHETIWTIITTELPSLLAQIRAIIPPLPE